MEKEKFVMSIAISGAHAAGALQQSQAVQQAKSAAGSSESNETAAQEAAESPATQAAEGEAVGSLVNTYA